MSSSYKNINIIRKRVLVAPLDWGLGHATRCIPIIKELIENNFLVILAAEGNIAKLFFQEFPDLTILPLSGYKISYSKQKVFFIAKLIWQIPKIINAITKEHKWLNRIIKENNIDIVISDNRYGLYNSKIKSIFITHQLAIQTGNFLVNKLVQKINYRLLKNFDECWIPDVKQPFNLAGKLSHPNRQHAKPVYYIGILSRFQKQELTKTIDLVVLISGPEPQRTILEKLLLSQMNKLRIGMVLIRGLPHVKAEMMNENKNILVHNHLPAKELSTLIQSSKIVVARSGYSTVMDLITLQQKAILIPTPGQTEQEYLAKYLAEKKYFIAADQDNFNLEKEIKNLEKMEHITLPLATNKLLHKAIIGLK